MNVVVRLKYYLDKRRMTQVQLAKQMDKSIMTVWKWTRGSFFPRLGDALKISIILRCKVDDIWKLVD